MEKIGIFGGSFNPPHKMHLYICNYLLNNNFVDKIYLVPTGLKYSYKNNLISNEHRLNMLKLLIKDNSNIYISDYELKNKEIHTYDTLSYFKKNNKDSNIYFICGLDNIDYLDKWYKYEELIKEFKFIIINREGYDYNKIKDKYKDIIIESNISLNNISSTYIRKNIDSDLSKYLDKDIIKYIKDNNLYRE